MSKKVTYNNNTPLNEAQKQDLQEILSTELPPGFFEKNPEFRVEPIDGGRFNSPTGTVGLVLGGFVAAFNSLLNGISSANNPNAVSKIGHQSTLPNNILHLVAYAANNPLSKEQSSKLPQKVKRSADSAKNDHVTKSSVDSAEDDHVAEGNELFIHSPKLNIQNISKKITENPAVTKLFVNRTPIKYTNLTSLKKMLEKNPQITDTKPPSN
ncbi:hypothetical protein [Candidatus Tisiphia endosymbiont of Ceraclea dissimilis]